MPAEAAESEAYYAVSRLLGSLFLMVLFLRVECAGFDKLLTRRCFWYEGFRPEVKSKLIFNCVRTVHKLVGGVALIPFALQVSPINGPDVRLSNTDLYYL